MKHKRQEALDTLYDEAACEYDVDEDTGELQLFDCTNQDKYLNLREPLQQLIDCQLTVEEIEWIILKASFVSKVAMIKETEELCKSICEKLSIQKEMWEEK